jgi:hypothetical protein
MERESLSGVEKRSGTPKPTLRKKGRTALAFATRPAYAVKWRNQVLRKRARGA